MNPEDVLAQLGLATQEFAPGYDAGAAPLPETMATPGEAMPVGQRNGAFDQAQVLAQLAGKGGKVGTGDRIAAGFGAKMGAAPSNPVAAALDGGMSGFAAAYGAGKGKGGLGDIKERMGLLKTLFDMERGLSRDRSQDDYRNRALNASERRTDAYVERAGRSTGKADDPLEREKTIMTILEKDPDWKAATDILAADAERRTPRLTPEQKGALEERVRKARERVEALGTRPGAPAAAAPAPAPAPATPSPQVIPPQPDSTGPNVKTVPNPTVDAATPAPAPKRQPQPAPQPKFSREQVIEQGRAANAKGVPLDQIIGRAKERGFDLTPNDFNPAPPAASPAPMPPTDPNGAVVGPQAGGMNIMNVLQSLFG